MGMTFSKVFDKLWGSKEMRKSLLNVLRVGLAASPPPVMLTDELASTY